MIIFYNNLPTVVYMTLFRSIIRYTFPSGRSYKIFKAAFSVYNVEEENEFEFPAELARRKFNELDSNTAIQLLVSASSYGTILRGFLGDRRKAAELLAKKLLDLKLITSCDMDANSDSMSSDSLIIGVDSSRRPPWRLLSRYYSPITTAIVYFTISKNKEIHVYYDESAPVDFFLTFDVAPDEAERSLKQRMYKLEIDALNNIVNKLSSRHKKYQDMTIFIDGPVMDPPNNKPYSTYIEERTTSILNCKNDGARVIGCVKRLEGHHFSNFLESSNEYDALRDLNLEGFGSDSQLIPLIFLGLKNIDRKLYQTVPIEITRSPILDEYRNNGIGKLYRTYFLANDRSPPICIEFFLDDNEDPFRIMNDCISISRAWTYPGLDVPIPVTAAHRRCNIGQAASEYLFRELLTKALSGEEGPEMVGSLTRGGLI